MATATKQKPNAAAPKADELRDEIERASSYMQSKHRTREAVMTELCCRNKNLDDPGEFNISAGEQDVVEELAEEKFRDRSTFAVLRLLRSHRSIMLAREQFGDGQTLADGIAARDEAAESLKSTTAALEDLDVDGTVDGPQLAKQIAKLQAKLAALTTALQVATARVEHIKAQRDRLRRSAPQWLRDQVERDLHAIQRSSAVWRRLRDLRPLIDSHQKAAQHFEFAEFNQSDDLLRQYAKVHAPEAYRTPRDRESSWHDRVDRQSLTNYFNTKLPIVLELLRAEQQKLKAEWYTIKQQVEAPLDHWIQFGIE